MNDNLKKVRKAREQQTTENPSLKTKIVPNLDFKLTRRLLYMFVEMSIQKPLKAYILGLSK